MRTILGFIGLLFANGVLASTGAAEAGPNNMGLTGNYLGLLCIAIFVLAYAFVMVEEFIHLPKSKPVILAAGLIWIIVGYMSATYQSDSLQLEAIVEHNLTEYAALFLFLLVAMTYINAMTERNVFEALRCWLIRRQFGYRKLFWITGLFAFFLSPIADNLTTALLMGAVVLAVGSDNPKFVALGCINIVVAANAGGAFSPFGDITTLMVWQSGHATFFEFFALFVPAVVNFMVPATLMSFAVPDGNPQAGSDVDVPMKRGALIICGLFFCTIATAVSFEQFLHLPPFLGMMFGMSYLFMFAYYIKMSSPEEHEDFSQFNIFNKVAQAEWDTLFFFFGVIFCVGGLGFIGYLEIMSSYFYGGWGATNANIAMGVISAVIDNIPVMFAILTMEPEMSHYQWLLITLTCGVGGSLLSIGSAAGVALMGQARGAYTFFSHLKWTWAIALGYIASIYTHYLLNSTM
ncbi:MAG: sodium:proton antiporter NhaD [SAR86 cluster bacterium]|uniref:Sodium:proton antiporter NhaD n=1 Tax=SAR86 cluster bacterium TaxID=2030880 RepID=A0A973A8G8_9GAMM|nr:sodium:proton antiporter NhaD [SAR86 cluster bacterium]